MLYIYADTRAPGTCRSCGATIEWAELLSGKRHPFNAPIVVTQTQDNMLDSREILGVEQSQTHFATCPDAAAWRRRHGNGKRQ